MSRRTISIGLVLLVGAAALLAWSAYDQRRQRRLRQQQRRSLKADISKIDKLVGDKIHAAQLADGLYWEDPEQSEHYTKSEEARGLVITLGGVLGVSGATLLGVWLVTAAGRGIRTSAARWLRSRGKPNSAGKTTAPIKAEPTERRQSREASKPGPFARTATAGPTEAATKADAGEKADEPAQSQVIESETDMSNSGAGKFAATAGAGSGRNNDGRRKGPFARRVDASAAEPAASLEQKDTSVLLCDEQSLQLAEQVQDGQVTTVITPEAPVGKEDPEAPPCEDNPPSVQQLIKEQTENLEKRMAEFERRATQPDQQEQANPLHASIQELTEQIAAIREYATHQEARVSRLQDGYDWSIVKNFCLRIIRCIDNLEKRIADQADQNIDTTDLEEVRDELVFALESTGVERFSPEINSSYRGQEKRAEAVKEKQKCDDPSMAGKIAAVLRPGYRYCIDDDNVKVVRAAQVRLYG